MALPIELIVGGISTVSQTVGAVVTSNNGVRIAQTQADIAREELKAKQELADIEARKIKTIAFIMLGAVSLGLVFLGIVASSKKPKYFQMGQSVQTYALSGIHVPKVA